MMLLSNSSNQSKCQSSCNVEDASSDWNYLYNSQLWSNSALRREIINEPFVNNKAIKCCYTCRGKIRNYEIKSPGEAFTPEVFSTPKVNNTAKGSIEGVNDINDIQLQYSRPHVGTERNEFQSIPSISRHVDKSFRQKYTSTAFDSCAHTSTERPRLRKSLKGIRCIFSFALTESPTKKRTQIKACSISVMIVAIVMISLILVNFSAPSLLSAVNKTSTIVVPTINKSDNETSSAIVSLKAEPSSTTIKDATQYPLIEDLYISTTSSTKVTNTIIAKIRKNIKTYPKLKSYMNSTKEIINRDLSQKFCSCQKNEVCMLDEDSGTSLCKTAVDPDDPTGKIAMWFHNIA